MSSEKNLPSKLYRKLLKTFPKEDKSRLRSYVVYSNLCLNGLNKLIKPAYFVARNNNNLGVKTFEDFKSKAMKEWNTLIYSKVIEWMS